MKTIFAIIEITRPVNVLITFVVVFVSTVICSDEFSINITIILAGLSASFVAAGGNIINDIFDIDIDKINRPQRVLPSGRINNATAKVLYFTTSFAAILIAYQISWAALVIVLITILLLYLYSLKFKQIPLLGNLSVAFCTALAFIYGGIAVGNLEGAIIPAIFAFLINLIREILKDIEDLEGDLKNRIVTFPGKYGVKKTKMLISIIVIVLLITTFYPFVFKVYSIEYFLIVLFSVNLILVFFLKKLNREILVEHISKLSNYLKLSMVFGLIAIYFG